MPEPMTDRWGRLVNKWHDETGPLHLLKPDNSPACGVSYSFSSGPQDSAGPRCKRCEAIAKKAKKTP